MIEITNLTFGYKKKPELFRGTELSFVPGRIYGVLGKNGAGKTTLLKLIAGLLFPQKGKCIYNNFNVSLRKPEVLSEFYFLPEVSFLPSVKITEFLEMYAPFYTGFNKEAFSLYLESFELNRGEVISNLSYGEKKKLALAFAFAVKSRVLLLDEPTNGLDIPAKSAFRKIISSQVTDEKVIIISTHQIKDMKNIIDQIMIIEEGDIIFDQNISDIENRLAIVQQHDAPNEDEALYYENVFGGCYALVENDEQNGTDMDLEFLFNAVIANSGKINQLFSKGGANE